MTTNQLLDILNTLISVEQVMCGDTTRWTEDVNIAYAYVKSAKALIKSSLDDIQRGLPPDVEFIPDDGLSGAPVPRA